MTTMYVCSYTTSYVINDQPNLDTPYNNLKDAVTAARYAYSVLNHYDDRYTAIEVENGDKIVTIFIIFRGQEAYGKEAGLLALMLANARTAYDDYLESGEAA